MGENQGTNISYFSSWEMLGWVPYSQKIFFLLDFVSLQIIVSQSLFNISKVKENFTLSRRGRKR